MINSFGTGKPTEADGSGRGTGKRTEAAAAVRAVRLFGLFGRRRLSSPAGERRAERSPTAAGATATAAAAYLCAVVFLRLSPIGGSGEGKLPRCDGCVGGCAGRSSAARALLPRMASGERSEAPPQRSCSFVVLQCCCLFVGPAFGRAGFGIAAAESTAAGTP